MPSSAKEPSNPAQRSTDEEEEDVDALFEALENEDDSAYRTHRIEQLNAEFAKEVQAQVQRNASSAKIDIDNLYPTLSNDQSLLDFTTQTHRCVIHFAHPDFAKCGVMDGHLRDLAAQHYEVRFARVDVRNIPFVVSKLNIRVLPYVIGFNDGLAVERVVGFEGLGNGGKQDGVDQFSTATLEKRLLRKGILVRAKFIAGDEGSGASDEGSDNEDEQRMGGRVIRQGNIRRNDTENDDDDDWD